MFLLPCELPGDVTLMLASASVEDIPWISGGPKFIPVDPVAPVGAGSDVVLVNDDEVLIVIDGERALDEEDDDISKGIWLFVSVAHTTGDSMPGMSLSK